MSKKQAYDTGVTPQPSSQWYDWRPAWQTKMEQLKAEGDTQLHNRTFE